VPKISTFLGGFPRNFWAVFGRFLGGCCAGFAWAIWQHWLQHYAQ